MTELTIIQIIGLYQHIAQFLQPLGELTLSVLQSGWNLPNLPNVPNLQSTAEGFSKQTGFPVGADFRDFTIFSKPHRAEKVDRGKAAAYPKGGFALSYALPQLYGYSVFNSGSPSANDEFFTAVNPDIFSSMGSATINPAQETLNSITKQYSTAITKNTSAINPIFAENSFSASHNSDISKAYSAVDLFSDNHYTSDVFQNSTLNENHSHKAVFSSHKGEELRQAVKTASSSSVYNGGAEIRVDMSGMRNTVNSRTDLDELIDRLCTELSQTALSTAEGVHF